MFISLGATVNPSNSSGAVTDGIDEAVADGIDDDGFNAVLKVIRDKGETRTALFATKDIAAGSELRYDHSLGPTHAANLPGKVHPFIFLSCAPTH